MKRDAFQAIADPTRREIIGMLSYEPMNINDLSRKFQMTRPGVSKHLKVLKECGVVTVEKKGRETLCHAKLDALAEVALWVSQYRMFWSDNLDHLERLLNQDDKSHE
ncbi:MAG: metalloregulator ArsR/SmtB family transcription factor [Cyclobacteriaceae bacterium]